MTTEYLSEWAGMAVYPFPTPLATTPPDSKAVRIKTWREGGARGARPTSGHSPAREANWPRFSEFCGGLGLAITLLSWPGGKAWGLRLLGEGHGGGGMGDTRVAKKGLGGQEGRSWDSDCQGTASQGG
ncbi:hypothetical protein H1C71_012322 [Ictidomys tridecemlineatus]|nr:hypothetical protein H1C71_012322 [Ictidomys tridecemlineatus]